MKRLLPAHLPVILVCIQLCITKPSVAQDVPINPSLLNGPWRSSWISCPGISQKSYGVYHFRKTVSLNSKPAKFIIHLSADNRYRFFVNGKAVCSGPARGDLYNWYFESIDIAPYLRQGNNTLAAMVWNMAEYAPVAQVSNQTAFLVQGDGEVEQLVNSDGSWKVAVNTSYKPCSIDNGSRLHTYMVVGPGDDVDASRFPWGWEQEGFNDAGWQQAQQVSQPVTAGYGTDNLWTLQPRNIPLMEEKLQRIAGIRRTENITATGDFLNKKTQLIPANQKVSFLLDQSQNIIAYPELLVSRGKGSVITVTYAESLFKDGLKGNRDSIDGKTIRGNYDIFRPDGGTGRLFRPLWLRTYRYIQLDITTGNEPLELNDFYGVFTAYPFKEEASFSSNDVSLKKIWDVGFHTARLCAGETYFDCPYYEQLQYEGDTRIQALISLYVTGDDRLMRKALLDFYHSRVPEGLPQGRYPSNRLQVIPPFALYWVSMVSDYWMHRRDDAFVQKFLLPVEEVLDWFEKNLDETKSMLGPMKWWNFTDWNYAFPNGVPDGATDGNSSVISLQFAYTLKQAVALFDYYGKKELALKYKSLADKLTRGTYQSCFNREKMEMANTPAQTSYSQHASIMGILSGAVPADQQRAVMDKILGDASLSQATFFYRFYLTQALKQIGRANEYYENLQPWRKMLAVGLTTFAENPDPTRSDCHAWSSSPNYDFLCTIAGIMPDAPGFRKVLVRPAPGPLTEVVAKMPHPDGFIEVDLKLAGKNITAVVVLPPGVTGRFVWNKKEIPLKSGRQELRL